MAARDDEAVSDQLSPRQRVFFTGELLEGLLLQLSDRELASARYVSRWWHFVSSIGLSSQQKVFTNGTLLEIILLNLPELPNTDLLISSQLVCRQWRATVQRSSRLQQKLWLEPVYGTPMCYAYLYELFTAPPKFILQDCAEYTDDWDLNRYDCALKCITIHENELDQDEWDFLDRVARYMFLHERYVPPLEGQPEGCNVVCTRVFHPPWKVCRSDPKASQDSHFDLGVYPLFFNRQAYRLLADLNPFATVSWHHDHGYWRQNHRRWRTWVKVPPRDHPGASWRRMVPFRPMPRNSNVNFGPLPLYNDLAEKICGPRPETRAACKEELNGRVVRDVVGTLASSQATLGAMVDRTEMVSRATFRPLPEKIEFEDPLVVATNKAPHRYLSDDRTIRKQTRLFKERFRELNATTLGKQLILGDITTDAYVRELKNQRKDDILSSMTRMFDGIDPTECDPDQEDRLFLNTLTSLEDLFNGSEDSESRYTW